MIDRRAHIKGKKKLKKSCVNLRDFYRNHFLYSGFHIIDKLLGTAQSHCKAPLSAKKAQFHHFQMPFLSGLFELLVPIN